MYLDPNLAKAIGLRQAIVLQRIHYLVNKNEKNKKYFYDNYYWIRITQNELQKQMPFIAINTLKKYLAELRKEGIIIATDKYNSSKNLDRTLWYRVNYNALEMLEKEFLNDSFKGSFKFLYPEYPLVINIKLAQAIGLNEAIVLQQMHYWINKNKDNNKNNYKGLIWTYSSYESWQRQFPFWSTDTVIRAINRLEMLGLLISDKRYNKLLNHTKWYTINYTRVEKLKKILKNQNFDKESIYAQFKVQKPIKVYKDSIYTDKIEKRKQQIEAEVADLPKKYKKITAALMNTDIDKEKAYELAQNYENERIRNVIYYYSFILCYRRKEINRKEVPDMIIKALEKNKKIPIRSRKERKKDQFFEEYKKHLDILIKANNNSKINVSSVTEEAEDKKTLS